METPNLTNLEAEASNESTSPQRLQELVRTSPELARWVAANSSAPSELLRELSENEDAIVREAVTCNPNTPTEILLELAGEFPEGFLDNPILPLLCIERPDFINTIPIQTAVSLLQSERAPTAWLVQASVDLLRSLGANENTPVAFLQKLANHENSFIRAGVAKNPQTPVVILETLVSDEDREVRRWIAKHRQMSETELEKLASDEDSSVRLEIAKNARTPTAALEKLAGDCDREVRRWVAEHHQTSESVLAQLANDKNQYVRAAVAGNLTTPTLVFKKLANDETRPVRLAVARNWHRYQLSEN